MANTNSDKIYENFPAVIDRINEAESELSFWQTLHKEAEQLFSSSQVLFFETSKSASTSVTYLSKDCKKLKNAVHPELPDWQLTSPQQVNFSEKLSSQFLKKCFETVFHESAQSAILIPLGESNSSTQIIAFAYTNQEALNTAVLETFAKHIYSILKQRRRLEDTQQLLSLPEENRVLTRTILASVSEMLLVIGDQNEIIFSNDRVHQILGYPTENLLGSNIFDFLSVEETNANDFQSLARSTNFREHPATMIAKDGGQLPVLITTHSIDNNTKDLPEVLITAKDVRDSRLLNELRSTQEQLVQSGKLAALGEMAAGIAHEINNPVAIIHAASEILELLAESGKLSEELVLKNAKEIRETAIRISKIVKGLRTISRDATKDELSPTTLQDVINDARGLCEEKIKMAGVLLKTEIPDPAIPIHARPSELAQVLLNLFNNSIDAMENQETKIVHISAETMSNGFVSLLFWDNGPGIPESILEQIFHPFFTTKEPGKGTGLGLSITKKIVEAHKGELHVSNGDRGAVFRILLPLRQPSEQEEAA